MIQKFHDFLTTSFGGHIDAPQVTLIFDKGNRSYWIPGSFEMSSSMSEPSNALPRLRTL
jgi:hypothetical protein